MEKVKIEIKTEPELIINDTLLTGKIHTAIEKIKQEQPVKCEICGKGFKCEDLEIHMTLHVNGGTLNYGNVIRKRKLQIVSKPKIIIPEPIESVKCQYCGKGFKREDLLIHEGTHIKTVKSIKCTICNLCNKWFDLKDFQSHQLSHRRSQLKAIVESKKKMSEFLKSLEIVKAIDMPVKKRLKVNKKPSKQKEVEINVIDDKTFMKIEEDRMINQPENVPVICKYCGKGFKSNDLKLHETSHEDKQIFSCNLCDKSFETKYHLRAHQTKDGGGFNMGCKFFGL